MKSFAGFAKALYRRPNVPDHGQMISRNAGVSECRDLDDSRLSSVTYIRENLSDLLLDTGNVELILDTIDETDVLATSLATRTPSPRRSRRRSASMALAGAAAIVGLGALTLGQSATQFAGGPPEESVARTESAPITPLHPQGSVPYPDLPSTPLHPSDPDQIHAAEQAGVVVTAPLHMDLDSSRAVTR